MSELLIKKYNYIFNIAFLAVPIFFVINMGEYGFINDIVNVLSMLFVLFTIIVAVFNNMVKKMCFEYIFFFLLLAFIIFFIGVFHTSVLLSEIITYVSLLTLPICFVTIDEIRISNKLVIISLISLLVIYFFNSNSYEVISVVYVLSLYGLMAMHDEQDFIIRVLGFLLIFLIALLAVRKIEFYIVLFVLCALMFFAPRRSLYFKKLYLLIYVSCFMMILFEKIGINIYNSFVLALIIKESFYCRKKRLLFVSKDLSLNDNGKSLVNFLDNINYYKYSVTLMLEKDDSLYIDDINKEVYIKKYSISNTKNKILNKTLNVIYLHIYSILNYNTYDFSCCYNLNCEYANKLARISSLNSTAFVDENYSLLYKDIKKLIIYFRSINLEDFAKIFFVSNEARDGYLKVYPENTEKTYIVNNFINIYNISNSAEEKLPYKKIKRTKIFVYVGELSEDKNVSRIFEIAREIPRIILWVIGNGKDEKKYKRLVKKYKIDDRVSFLGYMKEPYKYMVKADYIITMQDTGGFPMVYLEALLLKKEIITTFRVSDDNIDIKDYAHLISNTNYINDVKEILAYKKIKNNGVNLKAIQYSKSKKLEKLY